MKKYKLKHDSTLLGIPTMPTNDCNQITDAGMGIGKGQIIYGVPAQRKRMGAGVQSFIHISSPTHISGKEVLGMYVPASAVQEIREASPKGSSSSNFYGADGSGATKIFGLPASTAIIGAGLVLGFGTSISAYRKFKNVDWESMSTGEQGTAVGKVLGNLVGSLMTIGIGYAILLYDNQQQQKQQG